MFCRYSTFSMKGMIPSITQKGLFFNNQQVFGFSKTKSSKMWMNEHVTDEYVKKAQKDNYRSRATYKLIEIQERYKIFKQGMKVLELGSAPGGWTQVAVEFTKSTQKKPTVLAIDRDHMDDVDGSTFFQGDILDKKTQVFIPEFFKLEPVDVDIIFDSQINDQNIKETSINQYTNFINLIKQKFVQFEKVISDMAPNFSGDLDQDHLLIMDLNNMTIDVCTKNLKIGGTLVMKSLNGTMEKDAFKMYKIYFKEFLRVKPRASRARSSEIYYLGKGYGMSKEYEQLKKIEEKREKGLAIDDDDIPDLGFTDQELLEQTRQVILQMYDQGKTRKKLNELKKKNQEQPPNGKSEEIKKEGENINELKQGNTGDSISEEQLKEFRQIPGLNIDWDKLKPRTEEEIEKRQANYSKFKKYNDYRKYYGSKLSFTKNKPITMSDLATQLAEMPSIDMKQAMEQGMIFEDINKIKKKQSEDPIEDEDLFLSDEEEYDPYADEDERFKLVKEFNKAKDQYALDSEENDPYDPNNLYTPDEQPRTLADVKQKQVHAQDILAYERAKEGRQDYLEKLESGEAELDELDKDDLEDVMDDLEDEMDSRDMDKDNSEAEFSVTQTRENKYKDDHLKADDLDDIIFNKKKK